MADFPWTTFPTSNLVNFVLGTGATTRLRHRQVGGVREVDIYVKLGSGGYLNTFPGVILPFATPSTDHPYQLVEGVVDFFNPVNAYPYPGVALHAGAGGMSTSELRFYNTNTGKFENIIKNWSTPFVFGVGASIKASLRFDSTWGVDLPPLPVAPSIAAVGDSITAWIDRNGVPVGTTWPNFVGLPLVGGWAKGGAKIAEMVSNVHAHGSDVTVILAGTNDLGDVWGTPLADMISGILSIVANAKSPRTLICAVPPRDDHPVWATDWNGQLHLLAQLNGWSWCDPWASVRTASNTYVTGATVDGIHPTQATSQVASSAIHNSILGMT